jgi:hypothetical protein
MYREFPMIASDFADSSITQGPVRFPMRAGHSHYREEVPFDCQRATPRRYLGAAELVLDSAVLALIFSAEFVNVTLGKPWQNGKKRKQWKIAKFDPYYHLRRRSLYVSYVQAIRATRGLE